MSGPEVGDGRPALEQRITLALTAKDYNAATTLVLEGYGREIGAFLANLHRDGSADEVFSAFAETLWRVAPAFKGESSVRTWAYGIARRVSKHHRRTTRRRERRFEVFADLPALADVEARVRTETMTFLRTDTRSKLVALRDQLERDDQVLLMLRVDRKLPWEDLALVLHDGDEAPSAADIKRDAARLRKRFQLVKERLREAAREAGLLDRADR